MKDWIKYAITVVITLMVVFGIMLLLNWKNKHDIKIYNEGTTNGQNQVISYLITQTGNCNPLTATSNGMNRTLIDVNCIKQ